MEFNSGFKGLSETTTLPLPLPLLLHVQSHKQTDWPCVSCMSPPIPLIHMQHVLHLTK